ncbi:hypothetical protein [Actinotalea sp.]|uniref:hypothetical protein n=1 Tax=Actinotalea sp. TaxID=1872145 RepID=UPI00356A6967
MTGTVRHDPHEPASGPVPGSADGSSPADLAPSSTAAGPRPRVPVTVGVLGYCLAWLAAALGVGAAVGFMVGAAERALAGPTDTWADLAAVVLGLLAGVLAAMIAWLLAMVHAARRFLPPGRRLAVLGWSALAVVAAPVLVYAVFALVGSPAAPRGSVVVAALLAMAIVPPVLIAARLPAAERQG